MILYRLLEYISFVADFSILIVLYYVFKVIKGWFQKDHWTFNEWIGTIGYELYEIAGKASNIIGIISVIALLLTNTTIHQLVGVNNLKLKPEGVYCFFVEVTKLGGETCTLPAQIRIEKETDDSDDRTKAHKYYYIEKVFFSNGESIYVDDFEPDEIDEPSYYHDVYDNEWKLILLNEHAYSPEIKETNNANWFNIIFLLIEVLSISVILYALYKNDIEDKASEK